MIKENVFSILYCLKFVYSFQSGHLPSSLAVTGHQQALFVHIYCISDVCRMKTKHYSVHFILYSVQYTLYTV